MKPIFFWNHLSEYIHSTQQSSKKNSPLVTINISLFLISIIALEAKRDIFWGDTLSRIPMTDTLKTVGARLDRCGQIFYTYQRFYQPRLSLKNCWKLSERQPLVQVKRQTSLYGLFAPLYTGDRQHSKAALWWSKRPNISREQVNTYWIIYYVSNLRTWVLNTTTYMTCVGHHAPIPTRDV